MKSRPVLKVSLTLLIGVLAIQFTFSQVNPTTNLPDVFPVSPSAFSFMKYGEIPVSKYTGVPNISIPIYTINTGKFEMPIQLNYHSNGFRVNEESDWTGLGWTLDAGGSIVQVVNGYDDFGPLKSRDLEMHEFIDAIEGPSYNTITSSCTTFGYPIRDEIDPEQQASCMNSNDFNSNGSLMNNAVDLQPDLFKFNFMGYHGEFVLNWETEEFICLSDSNIKIKSDYSGNYGSTPSDFAITYPDGNMFIFEKKEETEVSLVGGINISYNLEDLDRIIGSTTSRVFKLIKIYTNEGSEISFDYEETDYLNNFPNISSLSEQYRTEGSIASQDVYGRFNSSEKVTVNYSKQKTAYLTKITFPQGKIVFNSSFNRNDLVGAKRLDNIEIQKKVSNTSYSTIKDFDFNYDYFIGHTSGYNMESYFNSNFFSKTVTELTHRLKLLSVQETGKPAYNFEYNEEKLPKKTSYATDYWGYYNGQMLNSSLFPNLRRFGLYIPSSYVSYSQNKSSDVNFLKAGVLNKISYPTGGYSIFNYELNTFDNVTVPSISKTINKETIYLSDKNTSSGNNIHTFYAKSWSYISGSLYLSIQGSCESETIDYGNTYIELTQLNKTDEIVQYLDRGYSGSYLLAFYQDEIVLQKKLLQLQYGETSKLDENYRLEINPNHVYVLRVVLDNACSPQISSGDGGVAQANVDFIKNDSEISGSSYGAGLRIKTITSYSNGVTAKIIKQYTYSGGKLMSPLFYWKKYNYNYAYNRVNGNGNYEYFNPIVTKYTLSSNSHYLSSSASGKYVGYDAVTVKNITSGPGYTYDNGKIITNYTNNPDEGVVDPLNVAVNSFPLTYPAQKFPTDNGLVAKEEIYTKNDDLLSMTENSYSTRPKTCVYGRMSSFSYRTFCQSPSSGSASIPPSYNNYYFVGFYPISSNRTLLGYTKKTNYFDGKEIYEITNYAYDDYDQLSSIETKNSEGEIQKTVFNYPYDNTGYDYNLMVTKGIIQPVIETNIYLNNVLNSSIRNEYRVLGISNSSYMPTIYNKSGIYSKKGNTDTFSDEINFVKYGSIGTKNQFKLLQYRQKEYLNTTLIWGYDDLYPIAKIENTTFSEVAQALGISTTELEGYDESNLSELNSLREALPTAMVTTYTYDPLVGVTSMTDPRGYTMYYEYDQFNRLKEVKDADGKLVTDYEYHYKNQ
ncbi:RHS repeat protein [Maribacter polysiphoniae]|uniref:RHS repeat protein n=1 Tax=Maribacter polysiphoniae TaxID=429344 RepID=A0A316DLA1_9FLAO|nr:RHS repeat domain-containing protein [Maribacter polysiphoniae]MBD1263216.1 RHS repeat protein [Maribacter polysiphoniae]PWK17493.1 YD repeat-containing protein [Maribacter polysiphoniae]